MNRPSGFLPAHIDADLPRPLAKPAACWPRSWRRTATRTVLLVLGLARGGVPVGWEVAAALHAPLDVFLVRKLGVPHWTELAMGALASGGGVVMNDNVVSSLHITDEQVREVIESETAELQRRERAYRGGSRPDRRPARQDRDPRRRRHRHRREHARGGARGAGRRTRNR